MRHPGAHLHLYGKREARPGRKMGHVTVCEDTPEGALAAALALRERLGIGDGANPRAAAGTSNASALPGGIK